MYSAAATLLTFEAQAALALAAGVTLGCMGIVFLMGAAGAAAGEIIVGIGPGAIGRGFTYCSGAASNFFAHPAQQKK
jgi:hypothetical protein